MHGQGLVTMSMREVDRMKVIRSVADAHLPAIALHKEIHTPYSTGQAAHECG